MIRAKMLSILFFILLVAPAAALEDTKCQVLLTPLLATATDIFGQPIAYPSGAAKVTAAMIVIPPDGETGWHLHQVPLFAYIMEGELTVDYGSKGIKVYKAGESGMEAMNWTHNGMNKGTVPVKIMAVYMGSDDKANTTMEPGRNRHGGGSGLFADGLRYYLPAY
jgi:quercetin dioxygenase-like cupin family protein